MKPQYFISWFLSRDTTSIKAEWILRAAIIPKEVLQFYTMLLHSEFYYQEGDGKMLFRWYMWHNIQICNKSACWIKYTWQSSYVIMLDWLVLSLLQTCFLAVILYVPAVVLNDGKYLNFSF